MWYIWLRVQSNLVIFPSNITIMTSSNGNIFRVTGLCAGNSPVTGEFSSQRPVMRNIDVFCDLRVNKRLSKQSRSWWFETPSRSLWRHFNDHNAHNNEICIRCCAPTRHPHISLSWVSYGRLLWVLYISWRNISGTLQFCKTKIETTSKYIMKCPW